MAYLHPDILDNGLSALAGSNRVLHICSAEPTTYAEASSTYTLGNKSAPSIGSPGDRTPNGRKVTVGAISDGAVTGTNTATWFALVDTGTSRLLYARALASSQGVTSGNTFSLTAHDIGIPAPA